MGASRRLRAAGAAGLLLAVLLAALPVAAQQQISTRAGAHDGFGRIVFDRPEGELEAAEVVDGRVRLRFAAPFASSYDQVLRHLYRYVSEAHAGEDGRTLTLTLLQPVTLRVRRIGKVLAVDLVAAKAPAAKSAAAGKPPSKAPDKPAKAAKAKAATAPPPEPVEIRAADHDGYSRFVFDWKQDVTYRVRRDGHDVTVTFDRPARFDVEAVLAERPSHLRDMSSTVRGKQTVLRLSALEHARYRHFRSGTSVVLDLLDPPPSVLRRQARKQGKPPAKKPPVKAQDETQQQAPQAAAEAAPPVSLLPPKDGGPPAGGAADQQAGEPAKAGAAVKRREADPLRYRQPQRVLTLGEAEDFKASAAIYDDGLVLDFAWTAPVPAAVFLRAGHLWLAFERRATLDLGRLDADSGVLEAYQVANEHATIFRLRLRDGLYPQVRRDEGRWSVRLLPGSGQPETVLAAVIQKQGDGSDRVFVPAVDTGSRQIVYDPEVGDEIVLVPLLTSGAGVLEQRDFVDFRLLSTAQGVVVRPNTDTLDVTPLRNGVEIAATQGLALSSAESRARSGGDPAGVKYKASLKPPLLLFKDWRGDDFEERRTALQQALARAPQAGRNAARLELAKFYLANDLSPEALALLQLIEEDDAGVVEDPLYRAMRGVARLQLHRLDQAQADLSFPRLKLYPDIALWRGALLKAQERYEEASRLFALGYGTLPLLGAAQRRRLTLDWAVAAALGGADGEFRAASERLAELPPSPKVTATIAYLNGLKAEALEQYDDALKAYQTAIDTHYRPVRARAELHKTDIELKLDRITPAEALARLERLRFAWRGDQFELDVIDRMVDLQLSQQDYGGALSLLRTAVSNFPEGESLRDMAKRMNATFNTLFLENKADTLHPVTALALYYEFQELTPLGADGDRMIQRLADRLADVDLLDRAGELLAHQVQYRLKGAERARVATRLAVIHLLDDKPEQALAALTAEDDAAADDKLKTERRYLRARALAELDKVDEGLALLEDDPNPAADRLRADILWRSRRWVAAAQSNEALLGERWSAPGELSEAEQTRVLQLAVSYFLAGDDEGLDRVRGRYADKISDGPLAETFRVLADRVDPASTEFRKLASRIASVAELESFMASYRDRMKRGGLSAIN